MKKEILEVELNNFIKRTVTSLIFGVILIFIIYLGFIPYFLFIILLIILGLNEFYNLSKKIGFYNYKFFGISFSIMISVLFFINNSEFGFFYNLSKNLIIFPTILTIFLISLFSFSILFAKKHTDDGLIFFKEIYIKISTTLLGIFYVGFLLNHLILIRQMPVFGKNFVFSLFFCVWAMDIFAYLFGIKFGRHKISKISPKKSVEGAIAGFIFAILTSFILHNYIFHTNFGIKNSIIIGILIGIFGQIGDLFESMIKRSANEKDSGKILPGHGGILDRFDSIIFVAPIFYYFTLIFIN
ncbi:MAG: phosphatidate cytidylyltransferase [Elusimicrobiota bacterium]|jgi:phosphatidate cytidylyltransferase|nr:phosphatidate cytidylyltransferase [Elusimicrobiota bacterium]